MTPHDTGALDSEKFARLVAVSRRLATDSDLRPALQYLLESAIALTGAERGLLLLRRDGALTCEAAAPPLPEVPGPIPAHVSRSVLARVLEGEAVLSTDMTADDRFRERVSVRRLGLRSVLAVPIPGRDGAAAFLYLDSRVSRALFRREDLDLLVVFAAQGALALENATLAGRIDLAARTASPSRRPSRPAGAPAIMGSSPAMRRVLELLLRAAPSELPVLIVGESGTGKELVARALHHASPRAGEPFVAENCAAIAENLIESELFGSVRGAFTGADRDREGLFRAAHGGTLFLDEIGEMPVSMQARLLRALQEGEVRPVGSPRAIAVDVRIVSATNRDPAASIAARLLRLDLYYRLAGVTIEIPPLRERREDIPSLAAHFLERSARGRTTAALRISPEALLRLAAHDWPGNVRELENEITRAAALARSGAIEPEDLSARIGGGERSEPGPLPSAERAMIEAALLGQRGNVTGAARAIGWSRQKLYRRMSLLRVPARYGRAAPP